MAWTNSGKFVLWHRSAKRRVALVCDNHSESDFSGRIFSSGYFGCRQQRLSGRSWWWRRSSLCRAGGQIIDWRRCFLTAIFVCSAHIAAWASAYRSRRRLILANLRSRFGRKVALNRRKSLQVGHSTFAFRYHSSVDRSAGVRTFPRMSDVERIRNRTAGHVGGP